MASYLRPRRGKKATAIAQLTASAPLKRGEVFFEVPDGGTGTGAGRIKMGDGSTAYESLPYFLEPFDPNSATVVSRMHLQLNLILIQPMQLMLMLLFLQLILRLFLLILSSYC